MPGARRRAIFAGIGAAAVLSMAGCSGAEPAAVSAAPSTAPNTGTAAPASGAAADAGRPADLETVLPGQSYWAVYLVVAPPGDPKLDKPFQDLTAAGYHPSSGELACDHGAAEQLTPTPAADAYAVRVFFDTQRAAQQFAARTSSPKPVGTARVQTYCVD